MDYNLGEWTREARESIKMTQEEMAFALGFSTKASVSAIENGRQQPTFESMVNIAKLTGFPLPYQNEPVSIKVTDGYIKFDVLNVEAKLGAGLLREHSHIEVVDVVTVAESWAKKHLGNNLSKIKIITARGDSMKGTIEDGEVLFVDESVTFYDGEGVYVVYAPDGLKAKRLQMLMTGDLKIISDNPKYEPEVISKKDLDCIQICGKVKGSWALSEF